jgi:hypothetical protein
LSPTFHPDGTAARMYGPPVVFALSQVTSCARRAADLLGHQVQGGVVADV